MSGKCCVFVDGENLRHSIVDLFSGVFDKKDYLPRLADWTAFYDWIVEEANCDCRRLRTYWYCVEHLDFRPFLPFPQDAQKLLGILKRDKRNEATLQHLVEPALSAAMQSLVTTYYQSAERMRRRFDGWRYIQEGISGKHDAIEFRRAGAITYDLFTGQLGREKAVDVKLAVDMNERRGIYDTAIIVSGDQDYVPAVQVLKDHGKRVINVSFEGRNGRLLPGGARRLNEHTDKAVIVKFQDVKAHLKL